MIKIKKHPKIKALISLFWALFFGLSLMGYAPNDNAWNTASNQTQNWLYQKN